jgi:hypothetical protein
MKMPTPEMIQAGNDFASKAMDVSIAKCLGELGSSREDRAWQLDQFKNVDLIEMYLNEEIDSVTGIYLAMKRAEELK